MAGLSEVFLSRYKLDLKELYTEHVDGIWVVPDDDQVTLLHALIAGPPDSPYEGGFFYFLITLPNDYPIKHPAVRLMTTGQGKVRFNPNLYANGKVCLSIIGTWAGPSWTSVMTLQSLLLSIRSLMHEKPYYNEPGYEGKANSAAIKASNEYNQRIRYDTIRVATRDMLMSDTGDNRHLPETLRGVMKRYFSRNYRRYEAVFNRNMNTEDLLTKTDKPLYGAIVKELQSFKKVHKDDDEISWIMYKSICEKFAPPPPKKPDRNSGADVDQFNEFLADAHSDSDTE